VSSPVSISWQSHPNEVIYKINFLKQDNPDLFFSKTTTNNYFQTELEPGNWSIYISSYSDVSMLNKYQVGIFPHSYSPFKVDIPTDVVSGSVSNNITWSGEVHITGDITIEEGTTLTIKPGTIIYLSYHDELQEGYSDYDKSVISITVLGDIIAKGTSEKPILFTPEEEFVDVPIMFWDGIHLNNSNNSSFEYCYLSCSNTGIIFTRSSFCLFTQNYGFDLPCKIQCFRALNILFKKQFLNWTHKYININQGNQKKSNCFYSEDTGNHDKE